MGSEYNLGSGGVWRVVYLSAHKLINLTPLPYFTDRIETDSIVAGSQRATQKEIVQTISERMIGALWQKPKTRHKVLK